MRAVIIANGVIDGFLPVIFPEDIVIAVDGGLRHCLKLKLHPHTLIGDMDSLSSEEIEAATRSGIRIRRYPARKDYTDMELALHSVRSMGADDIVLMGALGARWDMTIANIMLLAAPELAGCRVRILDGMQEISLVRGGETRRFEGNVGDLLSLIPLRTDAQNVCVTGLEYPLCGETLHFSATRGISNVFRDQTATVFLEEGLMLCVIQHFAEGI
ncbi:MAG: thiamine diphosphokinase [Deltaproteobacteria bacterium]|nr:thiamine diphosphokinase [Deltaproteobacteria bacterium]